MPWIWSTGASNRRWSTCSVDSLVWRTCSTICLVTGAQLCVTMRPLLDDGTNPVVLAGVGSDVTEDAEFRNVRIVFGVDFLELGMESLVAGTGEAGVALVDLDGGVALAEVDQMIFAGDPGGHGVLGISLTLGSKAFVLHEAAGRDSLYETGRPLQACLYP